MKLLGLVLCCLSLSAIAQHHQPYAGQQSREVKALSDEEAQQYLQGAGMGFARAAELNHFPGPMHVLELADKLGLSDDQRRAVRSLMDEHKKQARELGAKFVDAERAVDDLFRQPGPAQEELSRAVLQAARLHGEYRLAHLETHRRLRGVLTDAQVAAYDRLRGYSEAPKHRGG